MEQQDKSRYSVRMSVWLFVLIMMSFLSCMVILPNFLHPHTRSPVSRAIADMRSLSTALESYYVDHDDYSPSTMVEANKVMWNSSLQAPSFSLPPGLTTPVAYISRMPRDIMNESKHGDSTYAYWHRGGYYLLFSPGPDGDFDVDSGFFEARFVRTEMIDGKTSMTVDEAPLLAYLEKMRWDPTNGSGSSGDIWRSGGSLGMP